jgi:hypothetical protein
MPSSGMLRRVAPVRTDDSEELGASIVRVTRIGDLGRRLAVTMVFLRGVRRLLVTSRVVPSSPILATLMKEALSSSETSVFYKEPHDVISQKTPFFITKSNYNRLTRTHFTLY